ncbi:hypothetical protein glysoja_019437 [Glycine soja]|nr:hypothetical protein glysoja_019437 [Glycine soja]
MRRFAWFTPYRRHLLSSLTSESLVDKGESTFTKFSSSRQSFLLARAFSSSADRDHYGTLGVPENASQDEIKKAFHSSNGEVNWKNAMLVWAMGLIQFSS